MTRLGLVCDRILEAGWLAALVTVPLYFNIYSSRVFEPDKLIVLRAIVLIMCAAYLVKLAEARSGDASNRSSAEPSSEPTLGGWQSSNPLALAALALAVVYTIASVLSINPSVSFWGSYQRLQGTYSLLTYIALFFIVAQNLRSRAQVDRFVKVALLTSIPISLYGAAQHHHLDPLPWGGDVTFRVASTMGNAIFLAAYLIMVVPLTMARLVDAYLRLRSTDASSSTVSSGAGRIVGLALLLVVQNGFLAVFVKSSMGSPNLWWGALPVVGLFLVSSLAFVSPRKDRLVLTVETVGYGLLLILQLYAIFLTQSRGPWIGLVVGVIVFVILLALRRGSRRALLATSAAALVLAAFVVLLNVPGTPLAPIKNVPYVGRMGQLLETEGGTGKVRVLIWQGGIELLTSHPSIGFTEDPINFLRPLIGYGPETMYVAFNKVYPPDLAHYEARNATPDRSHMDVLDHLIMTGLLGTIAFFAVLYFGIRSSWRTLRRSENVAFQALLIGIISAVVAHFFETGVGIAIASTLSYLWALLGLSIAIRYIEAKHEASSPSIALSTDGGAILQEAVAAPKPSSLGGRSRQVKRVKTAGASQKKGIDKPYALADGIRWAFIAGYAALTVIGILFLRASSANLDVWIAYVLGFVWLAIGIVVAALSLGSLPNTRAWCSGNWWIYLPLAIVASTTIIMNLNSVVADVQFKRGFSFDSQRQWDQSIIAYQSALNLAPNQDFYYLFTGRAFLELAKTNQRPKVNPPLAASADMVRQVSLQDLARLGREDLLELSRASLEEALALAPLNTDHHANLGRLYRYWAELGDRQKLDTAIKYYDQATTLSPNAAHLWAEWAEVYLAKELPADAIEKARKGSQLDPVYAANFVYLGDAYLTSGKTDEALQSHLEALELDPLSLSDPRLETRLAAYQRAGIAEELATAYDRAAKSEKGRNLPAVHSAYGYILSKEGKLAEALEQFRQWVQLAPRDWLAHRNLAIAYDALGMIDQSIAEAMETKKLAPPDQQPALQNWINELQARKK